MHVIPILSTLRRHKTAAALIVVEIALTCAIVCNAIFLIGDRLDRMDRPSGLAEDGLLRVELTGIGRDTNRAAITAQDLAALRAIPGVHQAAATDMIPFGGSSWNSDISTMPDDPNGASAGLYMGSPDLLETWGMTVTAGREFTPDEYVSMEDAEKNSVHVPSIILTRALAEHLFASESPLGKKVYIWGKQPQVVVGLIEHVARPNEGNGPEFSEYATVLPVTVPYGNYLVRVEPGREDEVLAAIDATLMKVSPARIILKKSTFADVRANFFKQDRAMAWLLVAVSIALLVITALGVVGLASFWVQQRTRQIGIRRALGATRRDIRHYFQVENFILATLGIVLGMALAYAINLWLMHAYAVPRLPGSFLPLGAALLWVLGQLAVLGPAMRASNIAPAIATRSV